MKNKKLTKREEELLIQLQKGLSRKMAADECHMSKRTADTHLKNIFIKLDVHNISGALNKFQKMKDEEDEDKEPSVEEK